MIDNMDRRAFLIGPLALVLAGWGPEFEPAPESKWAGIRKDSEERRRRRRERRRKRRRPSWLNSYDMMVDGHKVDLRKAP